ncbi:alpha/beta hydrolase [Paenibacillaceae bacterium]|nr:alpha/beta hydrolase [Paenibacillaceae bacterium]
MYPAQFGRIYLAVLPMVFLKVRRSERRAYVLIQEEIELLSPAGERLYALQWLPQEEPPRAVICLVHGMGEHTGRYKGVAAAMTAAGFGVLTYDQRGHGRSPGKRGHTNSIAQLTEDAKGLVDLAVDRYPELPRVLYGHSMGGNVALNCALQRQPKIDALVLTSPWLRLAFNPPRAKQLVGQAMAAIWPSFTLSTGLEDDTLENRKGELPPLADDKLAHDRISAKMYFGLTSEGEWAINNAAAKLTCPLLLMHGNADNITSYAASEELAKSLNGRCTFVPWPGGKHVLHNEHDGDKMLAIVADWITTTLTLTTQH